MAALAITFGTLAFGLIAGVSPAEVSSPQFQEPGLSIFGSVLEPGTRRPMPGTRVVLVRRNPDSDQETSAVADVSGRFRFFGLQPGRYSVYPVPDVSGVPRDDVSFYGRQMVSIDLVEGQGPGAEVTLWQVHYSVISGRILDAEDRPMADVSVSFLLPVFRDGYRYLEPTRTPGGNRVPTAGGDTVVVSSGPWVDTDAAGEYRIPAPPGRYYLSVQPNRLASQRRMTPRYYPGVATLADAAMVNVPGGVDIPAMNLRIEPAEEFFVRFELALDNRIRDALERTPVIDPLTVRFVNRSAGITSDLVTSVTLPVEAAGPDTWVTGPVPPGRYEMIFTYNGIFGRGRQDIDHSRLNPILVTTVEIVDADLDLGRVERHVPQDIPGWVRPRFNESAGEIDLGALPPLWFREASGFSLAETQVAIDETGAFVLTGVPPGLYALGPDTGRWALPDGWHVESVRSGARDVLHDGLRVGSGPALPIEIVVSRSGGSLQGRVRTADDAPVAGADVVLVPPRRGPVTRYPTAATDGLGSFTIADVPPGEYTVLALDGLARGLLTEIPTRYWEDPDFLREYLPRGERVVIDPGIRSALDPELVPVR
jgi:hypothetical protein